MSLSRHRLRDASAFDAVFKGNTHRVSSHAFLFLAMENQVGCGRLGMVIGKKHIRLATRRNRVKRALRAAFRQSFENLPVDLVVVARQGVNAEDKLQLNEQVNSLMQNLLRKLDLKPNVSSGVVSNA